MPGTKEYSDVRFHMDRKEGRFVTGTVQVRLQGEDLGPATLTFRVPVKEHPPEETMKMPHQWLDQLLAKYFSAL